MKNTGIYFGIVFCSLFARTAVAQTCTGVGTMQVLVENCTATSAQMTPHISINPNPASELLIIKNDGGPLQIEIMDLLGRILLVKKLDGLSSVPLDVSNWPAGTYTACCRSERLQHAFYIRIEILR